MLLLLADIHIKLGQKNVPKDWAINRYQMFFDQVDTAEDDASMVIIPGDIFDRMPTLEELTLYFQFIARRRKRTIISTGNHEATKKGKSFFTELKGVSERLNPLVEVVVDYIHEDEDGFYVVPYEFIKDKKVWDGLEAKPVFTHVRGEIPPHVKPEIPLEWLDRFPVIFAGDLHSHSNTQRNIVYPGSPMTTSFHRNEVDTGYIMIDETDWSWEWKPFDLPQLIRKTVSDPSEMTPTDFHHTIYELEGNIKDLSKIENSDLLDKKLVKRSSDTALILDKGMTIADELAEYLRYIQEFPDKEVEKVMEVFNEYSRTSVHSME
jgi:DNA repair exonuclease SbcCD nuclease subunit